jgi:hypothetical protein
MMDVEIEGMNERTSMNSSFDYMFADLCASHSLATRKRAKTDAHEPSASSSSSPSVLNTYDQYTIPTIPKTYKMRSSLNRIL